MDHMVYIAASGANDAMLSQAINANNLANASTAGFRADLMAASSAYMSGGRLESRTYATSTNTGIEFKPGVINATGRDLDVAISGEGWMGILGEDGSEGLSRRGDLRVTELGQLVDGAGRALIGNSGGPIAIPPFSDIAIGGDGTISIVPLGEDPNTLAAVDRIKLVNPDTSRIEKAPNGMIRMMEEEIAAPDAGVTLLPGSLESSNVDTMGAMVFMIELSRQFEQHTKMMNVAQQLDAASAELMKMS